MDKKTSRRLLCIAMVFFWASEYCHAPYFTPYLESLGFGAEAIGIMVGMYGFTQIFARIPLGMITDAFSCYKYTILFGTICTSISSFCLMFTTSMAGIIICRIIAGLAASTWLAFTVLYNAYYKDDESVTAMTNANAFNNGGKLLAFFLGIITATIWGYKVPLLCSFLTGVCAIIAVVFLKPIEISHESFRFSHVLYVVKKPMLIAVSLFAIVVNFFMQGTVFSFISGRANNLGSTSFIIGAISLSFTLVQVLSAPYVGKKLLKKMKSGSALFLGFALLAMSALIVSLTKSSYVLILSNIFAGMGCIICNGLLMSLVVKSVEEEKRATAMGFYQAVYGIGMTLGPIVVGRIINTSGYTPAFSFVSALMAISALLALPIINKVEKRA